MKRVLTGIALSVLMLTACAPEQSADESPVDQNHSTIPPVETGQALDPIVETVVKQLAANLGLEENDISLVSNEEVEFSDSCFEVVIQNATCEPVMTPGRIIILGAKGIQYEYHTSTDGTRIQPATITLTWKREGGIAGFCDYMTIYRSGEVHRSSCTGGQYPEERLIDLLSTEEMQQMNKWVMTYGQINIDASDPEGVSDRMVVELTFSGVGSDQTVADSDQQELLNFAQELNQRFTR